MTNLLSGSEMTPSASSGPRSLGLSSGMLVKKAARAAMEKLLEKLSEHFGYAAPFMYAAAAYGFFHWLDENASSEAKALLTRTMTLKDYKNQHVASALVEVFDRIYTYPLLRWRTFFRSFLFSTVVTAIFIFEGPMRWWANCVGGKWSDCGSDLELLWVGVLGNFFTDYLALFVIRPVLIRSSAKPVIGLGLGAVSGAAIVLASHLLRMLAVSVLPDMRMPVETFTQYFLEWGKLSLGARFFVWPALAVFAWLPLFAAGILMVRLLTPLSWIVGRARWFLKDGKEHPLKAIGYVAAVIVFLGIVAWRVVFST